jgi:DNA-binding PadR family transcriptional regulator
MSPESDQTEQFPSQESSRLDGQDPSPEARRSNPVYELFVLGEIMSGPTYGYKLNDILNRILGPYQQLSWGTLYPLIRRLEREGLITATVERGPQGFPAVERGQPRRTYVITEAGRERFFALMLHPQSFTYHPGFFAVQLTKFEYLTPEQRLTILRHYRDALHALRAFYQKMHPLMAKNPVVREAELPFLLQLVDYRIHMLDAELSWFDQAIIQASKAVVNTHDTSQE